MRPLVGSVKRWAEPLRWPPSRWRLFLRSSDILLDRFPPRRIILPGILVFAAGLAALSRLTPHILQFYLTFFVIGLVANATAQFAYTRTILTWFTTHRGMALALLLTGSGVGSILIPPLTEWMIQHHGWRSGFLLLGGIALLGFPLTALLVRNRPEAAIARSEHHAGTGMTVAAALRTAAFWILAFITILSAFSENGLVTNLAPILTQHGVLATTAALALSVRGGAGIIGRLGIGFAIDRVSPERIQTLVLALGGCGNTDSCFCRHCVVSHFGSGDPWRRSGQRSRRGTIPARALFRPPAFLSAIRSYLDRVRHRRRDWPALDWAPL